ncbi:MAG: PAS domain-containing protein [Candidatus Omnitrophica bacterium]|nr:PAS domain-containing protein [Candidatus Omnitrophota bacterium]
MIHLNIRAKIILVTVFITAVVLTFIYYDLNQNLTENAYQRILSDLSRKLNVATNSLKENLPENPSFESLDTIADRLGENLDERVTIIRNDGVVLGDSKLDLSQVKGIENHLYRPEVQQALHTGFGLSRRFSSTLKVDLLYVAGLLSEKNFQGVVRLAIPLSEIALISAKLKQLLLWALLLAFALAILLSFWTSLFISKPVRELSAIAKGIAQGYFTKHSHIRTNDEIQDLSDAINEMSDQIKLRMKEVISNKSKLETVLLSMFDGLMVVDAKGQVLFINDSLKRMFHIHQDYLHQKPLEMIRNIEIQELTDKALEKKQGVESRQLAVFIPEEKILWIHATPILKEEQNDGAVLVFHDITELRRLEKIRQDFVANVSHELRTPVSTIKGYAETLLDGALEDKENARDFVEIIHSDANRLASLINDLLDLSRIESGKLKLDFVPVDLNEMLTQVLEALSREIQKKNLTVTNYIPSNFPKVWVDQKSITQVFYNLMDNAIKYNKEGGLIKISAEEKGPRTASVTVADTGEGIPSEDVSRIFERFYRVDKARSRELGGTGLGLSIVKHIIQAHSGEVSVESQLGRGSAFSFTLPKA